MRRRITIEQKIAALILGICGVSVALLCATAFIGLDYIQKIAVRANTEIGDQAAQASFESLEKYSVDSARVLAETKASAIAYQERQVKNSCLMLKSRADTVFKNRISMLAEYNAENANAGSDPSVIISAVATADAEKALEDQKLLSFCSQSVKNVFDDMPGIEDIFICTPNGAVLATGNNAERIADSGTDFRTDEWYKKASVSRKIIWTNLYDANGDIPDGIIATTATGVFDAAGKLVCVVGANIRVDKLTELVSLNGVGGDYSLVVDKKGTIIIASDEDRKQHEIGTKLLLDDEQKQSIFDGDMNFYRSNAYKTIHDGQEVYLAYCRISDQNWMLVTFLNADEAMAPAIQTRKNILEMKTSSQQEMIQMIFIVMAAMVLIFAVIFIVTLILGRRVSKRITDPLVQLTDGVTKISSGELDFSLDIHSGDEIEDLSRSFNIMTGELQSFIRNYGKIAAEREKSAAELSVAKQIQMSLLPTKFPNESNFEILAQMQLARKVGGDFYDFYYVDKTHVAVLIADVSGKGVPAALFMIIAKTLLGGKAYHLMKPNDIFTMVNRQLAENNDAGMFVTSFMGVLDITTGEFVYTNAGHNPPFIYRRNKSFELLDVDKQLFLGGMDDTDYNRRSVILNPGDMIFLYTDGVTETINADKELFTRERLWSCLNEEDVAKQPLQDIFTHVHSRLDDFSKRTVQEDDLTMLLLKFKKKGSD